MKPLSSLILLSFIISSCNTQLESSVEFRSQTFEIPAISIDDASNDKLQKVVYWATGESNSFTGVPIANAARSDLESTVWMIAAANPTDLQRLSSFNGLTQFEVQWPTGKSVEAIIPSRSGMMTISVKNEPWSTFSKRIQDSNPNCFAAIAQPEQLVAIPGVTKTPFGSETTLWFIPCKEEAIKADILAHPIEHVDPSESNVKSTLPIVQ